MGDKNECSLVQLSGGRRKQPPMGGESLRGGKEDTPCLTEDYHSSNLMRKTGVNKTCLVTKR